VCRGSSNLAVQDQRMNRPVSYAIHIKPLFTPVDIEHMANFGVDLGSYEGVKAASRQILSRLRHQSRPMPPTRDGGPWPDEWIALFERWMNEGFAE
jgi:hypothetical protein